MNRDPGMQVMRAQLKRKRIALVALIVVAVGMMAYRLVPSQVGATSDADSKSDASTSASALAALETVDPVAVTWPVELQRDLFRTTTAPGPLGPARDEVIRAEARKLIRPQIILQGHPARVLIEGHIVQIGDAFAGFTLVEVESRSIVVEKEGVQVRIDI